MSPLEATPETFCSRFEKTFNGGDLDLLVQGYAKDAVLNLGGDAVFRGHSEIRNALGNFLAPRLPIQTKPISSTVSGDTAVVMFEWVIEGRGPDGSAVLMKGSAVDVLQRSADGTWLQLLDCPFGYATASA